MLALALALPAGQSPPSALALSTSAPVESRIQRLSPLLLKLPVKSMSAAMSLTVVSSVRSSRKYPWAGMIPARPMVMSSPSLRVQPARLISVSPGL